MKILFTASECVPFCKTGGLADVVGALAPVLAKAGHDVRVILPLYKSIPKEYQDQMTHVVNFEVQLGWRRQYCGIEALSLGGVTYYFVDNKYYFDRPYVYGLGGDEYERFGFFNRAVLNALPLLGYWPEVIHAHDWQSGMIPALLRIQYDHLPAYHPIRTVFTIHNLQYQGVFNIKDVQDVLGLGDSLWTTDKLEYYGAANFLKAALVYADRITTVSYSYAQEIQTAYFGERLDGLLRARKNVLSGVLNGIDIKEYDPCHDPFISEPYTADDLNGKIACKHDLQEQLGLNIRPDVPIIGMVGRLSNQKGLDLIDYVITDVMQEDLQLVVLGMGDSRYMDLFSWAEQQYPGRVAARFAMDHELAHRIYAGADMFLMPSQFEPCGLSQMIAMRYGTVPIVRETGGLRDTVLAYNEYTSEGNGFTFFNYNAHDMLNTIRRAVKYYREDKPVWRILMKRGMESDFSWTHSAKEYINLYNGLLADFQKAEAEMTARAELMREELEKAEKEAERAESEREQAARDLAEAAASAQAESVQAKEQAKSEKTRKQTENAKLKDKAEKVAYAQKVKEQKADKKTSKDQEPKAAQVADYATAPSRPPRHMKKYEPEHALETLSDLQKLQDKADKKAPLKHRKQAKSNDEPLPPTMTDGIAEGIAEVPPATSHPSRTGAGEGGQE
jgi:starch synthase